MRKIPLKCGQIQKYNLINKASMIQEAIVSLKVKNRFVSKPNSTLYNAALLESQALCFYSNINQRNHQYFNVDATNINLLASSNREGKEKRTEGGREGEG